MAVRRLAFPVLLILAAVVALPAPAGAHVVAGSTWYTDGTRHKSGPVGMKLRVYAIGAIPNVPYKLVLGLDDDDVGGQCMTTVRELNSNAVYAGPSELIGTVTGTVPATTPKGTYILCFKDTTFESTFTGGATFTVQ